MGCTKVVEEFSGPRIVEILLDVRAMFDKFRAVQKEEQLSDFSAERRNVRSKFNSYLLHFRFPEIELLVERKRRIDLKCMSLEENLNGLLDKLNASSDGGFVLGTQRCYTGLDGADLRP